MFERLLVNGFFKKYNKLQEDEMEHPAFMKE